MNVFLIFPDIMFFPEVTFPLHCPSKNITGFYCISKPTGGATLDVPHTPVLLLTSVKHPPSIGGTVDPIDTACIRVHAPPLKTNKNRKYTWKKVPGSPPPK